MSIHTASRSPARATAVIVAGVVVVVAALVAVLVLSSGGKSSSSTGSATSARTHTLKVTAGASTTTPATPTSPAETHVVVLNGTETTGLAHRLATDLQHSGYSQASALGGTPPGSHQVSSVDYSAGHSAEAKAVAQVLGISQVQPMEGSVSALASGSAVVVVAGLDKAENTSAGGGGGGGGESVP